MLARGLRCLGRGLTTSALSDPAAAAAVPDLFTTVEDDGVGESGLLFSSPELLPVEPELTPLELFKTRPLLEPLGTAERAGLFNVQKLKLTVRDIDQREQSTLPVGAPPP